MCLSRPESTTIGIGDNPLLAKLALDNGSKDGKQMFAEWRYEDVPEKLWKISDITDFWGIGKRTTKRLKQMGIHSVYDLAHADYYREKQARGHRYSALCPCLGIDRSFWDKNIHQNQKVSEIVKS